MEKNYSTVIPVCCTFLSLTMASCSPHDSLSDHRQDAATLPALKGKTYEHAKSELTRQGWRAIPAICTERKICSADGVLATSIETARSCAEFARAHRRIELCVRSIPDGSFVESIRDKF
jgi:hypothetical protein